MGILLPMAVAAYGLFRIIHPKRLSYVFHTPIDPPIMWLGICALGIALAVHGLGLFWDRING